MARQLHRVPLASRAHGSCGPLGRNGLALTGQDTGFEDLLVNLGPALLGTGQRVCKNIGGGGR